ncbi:hypothetical protein ES703_13008 [subsurface metagenome]
MVLEDDLKRYQYGRLAGRLYQSEEGRNFIPGALEQLMNSLHEDAALSTGVAIKHGGEEDIIGIYSGKYQKALNSINIEEYLKQAGIDTKTIKDNFGQFFSENYEIINSKIEEAKDILKGRGYKFLEGEKEKARENIKKYGAIYSLINLLESRKFENLRGEVAGENYSKSIDELSKNPEKYVETAFANYLKD